jgi:SH3-like domain-containing protein
MLSQILTLPFMANFIKSTLLACIVFSIVPVLYGQDETSSLQQTLITKAACAWESVPVRVEPGTKGKSVATVYFGEIVTYLGQKETLEADKRTYQLIRTADGKEGWIHEYLFIENGVVAVLTRDMPIYKRPGTATTVTGMSFIAGELVILDQFEGEWMHISARKKERTGWVKGKDDIKVEERDIEAASLIFKADQDSLASVRIIRLEALRNNPTITSSSLGGLLEAKIAGYKNPASAAQATRGIGLDQQPRDPSQYYTPSSGSANAANRFGSTTSASAAASRTIAYIEEIADVNTGEKYMKHTEEGTILEVLGPAKRENEFFAYHKTLPIGSEVFLQIPDNGGFIKLTIVDKLSPTRNESIALSKACIRAVYGNATASQRAKIIYYTEQ